MGRNRKVLLVIAIASAAVLFNEGLRLFPESSPVERGAAIANSLNCIECHGRTDPGFPDDARISCTRSSQEAVHDRYHGACRDILAYFEAVRLKRTFSVRMQAPYPNRLLQGEILARQYNCFLCHGELGQGGFLNEGSLKGYIPGYFGNDFALLTQDGDVNSVRAWIRHGVDPALTQSLFEGSIAEYFLGQQAISMPRFGSLPDSTIQVLADYVIALNRFGAMDAAAIRAYSKETMWPTAVEAETQ